MSPFLEQLPLFWQPIPFLKNPFLNPPFLKTLNTQTLICKGGISNYEPPLWVRPTFHKKFIFILIIFIRFSSNCTWNISCFSDTWFVKSNNHPKTVVIPFPFNASFPHEKNVMLSYRKSIVVLKPWLKSLWV